MLAAHLAHPLLVGSGNADRRRASPAPPGVRAAAPEQPPVPPPHYASEATVLPPTYDGKPARELSSKECGRSAATFADNADDLASRMESYRGTKAKKKMFEVLAVDLRQLSAALRLAGADFDPRAAGELTGATTYIADANDLLAQSGTSRVFSLKGNTKDRYEGLRANLARVTRSLGASTLSRQAREEHERIERESSRQREAAGVEAVRKQLDEQERKQEQIIAGLSELADHVASLRAKDAAEGGKAVSAEDEEAAPLPALSEAQKHEMDVLFRAWFERSRKAAECDAEQLKAALCEAQWQLPVDLDVIVGALGDTLREEIAAALAPSQGSEAPSPPPLPAIGDEQAR